ncbi:hypothetical protein [Spirillospora sp. NPDC048819]
MALDVRCATGMAVLRRPLDHADVLVTDFSPETNARLGIRLP